MPYDFKSLNKPEDREKQAEISWKKQCQGMPQIGDRKWTSRLKKGKLKDVHTKIQSEQVVKRQGEF